MHVLARSTIARFSQEHADARDWLAKWWEVASKAHWTNLEDVRATYATADQIGGCLIFDCKGNDYRLVVQVSYRNEHTGGTLFVKHFMTHAEYSKDRWKDCCE